MSDHASQSGNRRRLTHLDPESITRDLARYRALRGFCAHDLRSQIGAVVGLLSLVIGEMADGQNEMKPFLRDALAGAEGALEELDRAVHEQVIEFRVVWLVGDSLPTPDQYEGERVLTIRLRDETELRGILGTYRPDAVVLDPRQIKGDIAALIQKIGPMISRIFVLAESETPNLESASAVSLAGITSFAHLIRFIPYSVTGLELGRAVGGALRARSGVKA